MAIWSTIGKALGSVAGSLIGAGGSIAGAGLSYAQQKSLQANQAKINYEYAEKSARNTPTWNRAGLESAGYNPMLAVQNSTSGANASWTSAQSANSPDISNGLTQGLANAQSFQRLKNETLEAESSSDSYYAAADKLKAEKAILIKKLPYVDKQAKADYMKTAMESAKLENDIHYQNEYLNYLDNSLKLQEKLGLMGIDTQRRGQDLSYNASTYSSNISRENNMRTNRSNVSLEHIRHPYSSFAHKSYTSGKDYKRSYRSRDPFSL